MRTFSPHPTHLRGHRPEAVVVAVGDQAGVEDAVALLDALPPLTCPIVVCAARDASARLHLDLPGGVLRECEPEADLGDAATWIVPPDHLATVDRDRWALVHEPDIDHDAQLGRLCSSLKASYRSRVFLVSTGPDLDDNPLVRLLVMRGAPLVATRTGTERRLGDHAPVSDIVAHLGASVGALRKVSA